MCNDTENIIRVKPREMKGLQLKNGDPQATPSILKLEVTQQTARHEFINELNNGNLRDIEIYGPVCTAEAYIPFDTRDRLGIPEIILRWV